MSRVTERWPSKLEDQALDSKLANLITKRRKKSGITQTEVAKRMGLSDPALCNWEQHNNLPDRLSKWQAWCRAVGLVLSLEIRDLSGKKVPLDDGHS